MNINTNLGQVYTGTDSNSIFSGVTISAMSKEEFVETMDKQESDHEAASVDISSEGRIKLLDVLSGDGKIHVDLSESEKEQRAIKEKAFQGMIQPGTSNKVVGSQVLQNVKDRSGAPILNDYNLLLGATAADFRAERGQEEYYGLSQRAEDITKAYAKSYADIVKGYQDGTRKAYAIDDTSETGYRLMTMEEELAELDKAYEKSTEGIAAMVKQSGDIAKALEKYADQLARSKRDVNADEVRKEHKKYAKDLETVPKDLDERMRNVAQLFKDNFKADNKLSMDFLNSLMKKNYYLNLEKR